MAVQLLYKRDKEGERKRGGKWPSRWRCSCWWRRRGKWSTMITQRESRQPAPPGEGLGGNCCLEVPVQLPYKRGNPTPWGRCVKIALERAGSSTIACREREPRPRGWGRWVENGPEGNISGVRIKPRNGDNRGEMTMGVGQTNLGSKEMKVRLEVVEGLKISNHEIEGGTRYYWNKGMEDGYPDGRYQRNESLKMRILEGDENSRG